MFQRSLILFLRAANRTSSVGNRVFSASRGSTILSVVLCLLSGLIASAQDTDLLAEPAAEAASTATPPVMTRPFASDREYDRLVKAIDQAIQQQNWSIVCERLIQLQTVSPESLAQWRGVVASVPLVASHLVQLLPEEGKKTYQRLAQPVAEEKLRSALRRSDLSAIERVARFYRHTPAGNEALLILLRQRMDRGEWEEVSLMLNGHLRHLTPPVAARNLKHLVHSPHGGADDSLPESMQSSFPSLLADWEFRPEVPAPVRETLARTTRELRQSGLSPYPASSLLSIHDGVVICGPSQRIALDAATGRLRWRRPIPGYMARWMEDPGDLGDATRRRMFTISVARRVFDESVSTRTQTDGRRLFFVETIPPTDPAAKRLQLIEDPFPANRIVCAAAETGETEWVFNGLPVAETFFNGPPAIFGDRLYVLGQSATGIVTLFTLDAATGAAVQTVELSTVHSSPSRRDPLNGHSAVVDVQDGQLLCATASGTVLSIDPLFGEIDWAVQLPRREAMTDTQESPEGQLKGSGFEHWSGWQSVQILSAGRRLIFVAPGTEVLTALDADTGKIAWQVSRENALHLAGTDRRSLVLAVSRTQARGIDLDNGRTRWTVEIPEPAGRGLFTGQSYLFPILEQDFARLDLSRQVVEISFQAELRTPHPDGVLPRKIRPRHLFSAGESVYAVSLDEVRKLQSPLRAMARTSPASRWETLLSRAERGDWEPGLPDWHQLLQSSSPSEHALMRETMRALLSMAARREESPTQQDQFRSQVDELSASPLERAAWRQLQARDRVRDQDWTEFVSLWLTSPLAELDVLLPGEDGNSRCRLDRWFQATFLQSCATLPPAETQVLRQQVRQQLDQLKSVDVEEQRRLHRCLGKTEAGREFALRLPDLPEGSPETTRQQLEWLSFTHDPDPAIAAGAAERLLAVAVSQEQWKDARDWLTELQKAPAHQSFLFRETTEAARREVEEAVRNGFATEYSSDWPAPEPQLRSRTGRTREVQLLPIPVHREAGQFFARTNVEMDFPAHEAIRFNGSAWKRPWYQKLPRTDRNLRHEVGLDRAWTFGNFCVLQTGSELYGIRPLSRQNSPKSVLLWPPREDSVDTLGSRDNLMLSMRWMPKETRPGFESMSAVRMDEFGHHFAAVGPVRAAYLCLQQMGMLVTLETATGREFWRRYDLPQQALVCGNDTEIAVIAPLARTVTRYRVLDGAEIGQHAWTYSIAEVLQQQETLLLLQRNLPPRKTSADSGIESASDPQADPPQAGQTKETSAPAVPVVLQQLDVSLQRVLWQREWPSGSLPFEIDRQLIGMFLPSGQVELIESRSGQTVSTHTLPVKEIPRQIVASVSERDVIIVFSTLEPTLEIPDELRMQLNYRQPFVSGMTCCFRRGTGELLWQQELPPCVFRQDQPVDLPVFVTLSQPAPTRLEPEAPSEAPAPPEEAEPATPDGSPDSLSANEPGAEFNTTGVTIHCHDRRTGRRLGELKGEKTFYSLTGDHRRHLVTLDTVKTRLEIDFSEKVKEPADSGAASGPGTSPE